MRTFTIEQIKTHFVGVPYSYSQTFITLLIRNKILVRMSLSTYAYDLDMLSKDVIDLIVDECKTTQMRYQKKYYDNQVNSRAPNKFQRNH
jgi:hypothetical protein